MGRFQVTVKVTNPLDRSRFFEAPFRVDTGALYSFVPEDRLHAIGIVALRARDWMADGRRDRRLLGEAIFTLQQPQESLTCPVVFAPPGSLLDASAADPVIQLHHEDLRSVTRKRVAEVAPW
ncbi:MAG TPA: hypothetical protein VMO26_30120 [Vicinamibacterales bacterium]|nr:hypothetical protein [Vicinamibacterales bacterium]